MPGMAKDIDELLNVIMCQKSDAQRFHNADCIFKKCDNCKNTKISELFSVRIKKDDAMVTWNHWERVVQDGKPRRVLKNKRAKLSDMDADVSQPVQGTSFGEHIFTLVNGNRGNLRK